MSSVPITVVLEGPNGTIRLSPPLFLNNTVNVNPADLSKFAPHGNGIYGLQHQDVNPFKMAPPQDAEGGVVFFDPPNQDDFFGLLRLLDIANRRDPKHDERNNRYWAFEQVSEQPGNEGYLKQIRVVDRFGLRFLYGALDGTGYDTFPEQPLSLPDFLWSFIVDQVKEYGRGFGVSKLAGKFGGDGHYAQEALSFGLMVENSYHHVYRIWSRAWLVTK